MTGLPVIASAWSGQLDFINDKYSILLGGQLQKVPKVQHWKDIIIPESQWFTVDQNQVYKALNYCFENYETVKSKGKTMMDMNRNQFTLNKMTEKLDEIIEKYIKDVPQQVGIQLPKLKKIGDSPKPKLELPKLKRVTKEGAPA